MWVWSVGSSLAIALPYFAISYFVLRGLVKSRQLRSNPLGMGTGLIFLSCGTGHLLHAGHMLFEGQAYRDAADLHMTVWDFSTAGIALWYLSMRARYGQLLLGPSMFEDHSRAAAEAEARHAATHDHLTALPNRQALFDAIDEALRTAGKDDACALLFLDLDGFKAVNDRFGHVAGDALLVAAAKRLSAAVRPGDLVARLGGDEFVTLLVGPGTEEAAIAVALRQADAMRAPFPVGAASVGLTVSVGIALTTPDGINAAELVHRADVAMYKAKQEAPGRYHVYVDSTAAKILA
jgi:diguanylate cyclase (GGDEF)-like protein